MIDPKQIHSGVRNGDKKAESDLASFVQNLVRAEFVRDLGPLADDYLQDLAIRVIDGIRRNQVEHPQFLVTFIRSTAKNVRVDGVRTLGRRARRLVPLEEGRGKRSQGGNPERDIIQQQELQTIFRLIAQLDPVTGEIIQRHFLEQQPLKQIAREMELTADQARDKMDWGRAKVRREYQAIEQQWRTIRNKRPGGGLQLAA